MINSIAVYIDGINRTSNAVMPFKTGNFLDERLDEGILSLRRLRGEALPPLTPVEIIITQTYDDGTVKSETLQFLVASDSATENPVGSGYYDHDLSLIEVTKYAECLVVDTLTFTNDLGANYTENARQVVPYET